MSASFLIEKIWLYYSNYGVHTCLCNILIPIKAVFCSDFLIKDNEIKIIELLTKRKFYTISLFKEKQNNNDRKSEKFSWTFVAYEAKDALVCLMWFYHILPNYENI